MAYRQGPVEDFLDWLRERYEEWREGGDEVEAADGWVDDMDDIVAELDSVPGVTGRSRSEVDREYRDSLWSEGKSAAEAGEDMGYGDDRPITIDRSW